MEAPLLMLVNGRRARGALVLAAKPQALLDRRNEQLAFFDDIRGKLGRTDVDDLLAEMRVPGRVVCEGAGNLSRTWKRGRSPDSHDPAMRRRDFARQRGSIEKRQ
jgi:hypothetical protein